MTNSQYSKKDEVEEKGFYYTGMSARAYQFEEEKKRAQKIKDKYKGADFRIVSDSQQGSYGYSILWKHIYGNDIFRKAQYYNEENTKAYIDGYEERKELALMEYKKKLIELEQEQNKKLELYNEMKNLKKF